MAWGRMVPSCGDYDGTCCGNVYNEYDTGSDINYTKRLDMSFGGPPPSTAPPSGPFEESITKLASSPYTLAAAIFLINIGGRFLPMEISKGQEQFLNTPWFRRGIIFVIFFLATRNIITAGWISLVVILCIGYLFNENSSLYLFGKGGPGSKSPTEGDKYALTNEEHAILKSLQEKASKIQNVPVGIDEGDGGAKKHAQYKKVISKLWNTF